MIVTLAVDEYLIGIAFLTFVYITVKAFQAAVNFAAHASVSNYLLVA